MSRTALYSDILRLLCKSTVAVDGQSAEARNRCRRMLVNRQSQQRGQSAG